MRGIDFLSCGAVEVVEAQFDLCGFEIAVFHVFDVRCDDTSCNLLDEEGGTFQRKEGDVGVGAALKTE